MIVRKLDITKNYIISGVRHLIDDAETCDNCGKIITNIITLKDDDGNFYNVGTECAKMIDKFMNTWDGMRELKQAEKNLKNEAKFNKWVIKKAVYKKEWISKFDSDRCAELYDAEKKLCYKSNLDALKDKKIIHKINSLQNIE